MRFAKRVFLIGGVYGLVVMLPMYFLEEWVGVTYPPPITHPEYFYLFVGITVVWQILFIVISRNPLGYRPLMLLAVLEKAAMLVAFLILAPGGRFPQNMYVPCAIDIVLGFLFLAAYLKTKPAA